MTMEVTDRGVGMVSIHSTRDVGPKADLRVLYHGLASLER